MRFTFEVLVSLKPGLADPQGKAVESALPGARVDERVGRARRQAHAARRRMPTTETEARAQVEEMAARLLSNPVIEDFRILEAEEA